MRKILCLIMLIPFLFNSLGCATIMRASVNGYIDPDNPVQILPGSKIHVMKSDSLKSKEVRNKIIKILQRKGYQSSDYNNADYYLVFENGIGNPKTLTTVFSQYNWIGNVGLGTSVPISHTLYTRWLVIGVADGKDYRKSNKFKPVWVGETISSGSSSDLRLVINYLIVATFDQFGQSTGKTIVTDIYKDDVRAKELD